MFGRVNHDRKRLNCHSRWLIADTSSSHLESTGGIEHTNTLFAESGGRESGKPRSIPSSIGRFYHWWHWRSIGFARGGGGRMDRPSNHDFGLRHRRKSSRGVEMWAAACPFAIASPVAQSSPYRDGSHRLKSQALAVTIPRDLAHRLDFA
jgi:hypothetical protein